MAIKRLTFDFETRSACNLKKAGAYKYSLDPTTRPTCMAFKVRGNAKVWLLKFDLINRQWKDLPDAFQEMWWGFIRDGYLFTAHNAFFETCIYKNILVRKYGWPDISFKRFRCTAAKAAACALPRSLEGAGAALELTTQKDKSGYVAMMATCKPTKQWNAWRKAKDRVESGARVADKTRKKAAEPKPSQFLEYAHNPEIWETLYRYCIIDVRTEELLDKTLPDLISLEQEIWFLNQRLNWRGLRVDIGTSKKIVEIMSEESRIKLTELDTLTMGLVTKPGARKSILEFLALEDVILPDLRAKTVQDFLKEGNLSGDMKRLLEIRQQLSKTSTKKYQTFLDRAMPDWCCRDITLYHGASTGRDTGTGLQPHNFPRGVIPIDKDKPYAAVKDVIECDYDLLKLLYGDSLSLVFSSILRNMIIPREGRILYVADFSKIEVAVLWWLAENWPGLKILSSGKDPYKYQAAFNMGVGYDEISDEGDERQLGKAQTLGCGFGMGKDKFQSTAWDMFRLKLTIEQAAIAVKNYRKANSAVVDLWYGYENAFRYVIENPGSSMEVGRCIFFLKNGFGWIQLPSGRRLAYKNPRIVERFLEDGESTGTAIQFDGLSKDKKTLVPEFSWGGKFTENIVQAVARDLMMPAMLRLEARGYTPLLSVHDEGICEKEIGKGSVEEFVSILCEKPKWADKHLPLEAKGWSGERYRK